jgi:hypothetical protein
MLSKLITTSTLLTFTEAGKCPFGFDNETETVAPAHPRVRSTASYPSDIFPCAGGFGIATTVTFDRTTYKNIVAEVVTQYEKVADTVAANLNPRANYAGCLVRAAGHDFMDFRKASDGTTSGGSDGCINFTDDDNLGLSDCLAASGLSTVYENYCASVSLADFLVISAEAVMGRTAERYDANDYYAEGSAA